MPERTVVWLLGHTCNLSLSYGLYSKGMDVKQLKEAIDLIPTLSQLAIIKQHYP